MCDVPADLSSWSKLFMIAKCVLASPATGHHLRWREITTLVTSRIDRWRAGDVASLWSEAVAGGHSLSKRAQSSSGSQRSRNIRRAKLAVQDGQYSKAIKALTSNGMATLSAEVLEEMLEKHPQVPPPTLPSGPAPPPLILSESVVKRGVRSFSNGRLLVRLVFAQATSARQCAVPRQIGQLLFCLPSLSSSTSWRPAKHRPPSPHTYMVPRYLPAGRGRVAIAPLLSGRCCDVSFQSALPPSCAQQPPPCLLLCSWE